VPARPQAAEGSERRLLKVKEAATYLGTTPKTLYSMVWRKQIVFVKIGRSVRFDIRDLDAIIQQSKVKPQEFPIGPASLGRQ